MEMKKLEQSFSVCQVENYSLVNLDAEYCFIGKTDEETSLQFYIFNLSKNTFTHMISDWTDFFHKCCCLCC